MKVADSSSYAKQLELQVSSGPIIFTAEHRSKNMEVYEKVRDVLPLDDVYKVNDCDMIYRFLIGKHWNVAQAVEGIKDYAALRAKESVNQILGTSIDSELESVVAELYGTDLDGNPVLWFCPDQSVILPVMKKYNKSDITRANIRQMEQARFCTLACGRDRCTYVMDLANISMKSINMTTVDFIRDIMKVLQQYYPEIMRRLIICNAGWAVMTGWKMLQSFVDARIQDKLKFYNKAPTVEYLAPYMTEENVHPRYRGAKSAAASDDKLKKLLDEEFRRVFPYVEKGQTPPPPFATDTAAVQVALATSSITSPTEATVADTITLYSFGDPDSFRLTPSSNADFNICRSTFTEPITDQTSLPGDPGTPGSQEVERMVIYNPGNARMLVCTQGMVQTGGSTATPPLLSPALPTSSSAPNLCELNSPLLVPAAPFSRVHSDISLVCERHPKESVSGIPTGKHSLKKISSFERCVHLSLTYTSPSEIICHYKGHQCAVMRRSRVFAKYPLQGVDNDDQDGAGAVFHNSPSVPPSSSPPLGPGAASPEEAEKAEDNLSSTQNMSHSSFLLLGSAGSDSDNTQSILSGEVLHEAGHYLHTTLLVCDGDRRVNFILKRSRLRNRITVFMIMGTDREVHTTAAELHYFMSDASPTRSGKPPPSPTGVKGRTVEELSRESVHIGTVLPRSTARPEAEGPTDAWVMLGSKELVYRDVYDSSLPSDQADPAVACGRVAGGARLKKRHAIRRSLSKWFPTITPREASSVMIAQHNRQELLFYGDLAYWYPPHDLFALGAAITRLWTLED